MLVANNEPRPSGDSPRPLPSDHQPVRIATEVPRRSGHPLVGRPLAQPARRLLGLALSAPRNPPPHVGHVLALAAHNIPIASWPLLLGVLGAHRHRLATHVADGVLLACIIANTLPVGAALGAYGTALLAYHPAAASGVGRPGARRERVARAATTSAHRQRGDRVFVLIACVLLCAAALETVAVPHR